MPGHDALAPLHEAAVLWSIGAAHPAEVIEAACDCLVNGLDSPSLRILAGVSAAPSSDSEELRRWLRDTLTELSLPHHPEGSRAGEEEALRIMARRLLTGGITPHRLASWAYRFVTAEGTRLAAGLVTLADTYEYLDAVGHASTAATARVDALVIAEARRLLGDTSTHRRP